MHAVTAALGVDPWSPNLLVGCWSDSEGASGASASSDAATDTHASDAGIDVEAGLRDTSSGNDAAADVHASDAKPDGGPFGPVYDSDSNGAGYIRTSTVTEATYDGVTFYFNQPVKVGHFHTPTNYRELPGQIFFTKAAPEDPTPQVTGWSDLDPTEDPSVFRNGAMYPMTHMRYGVAQGFWCFGSSGNVISPYETSVNAANNLPLVMEDRRSLVVGVTSEEAYTNPGALRTILAYYVALTYVDGVPEEHTIEYPKVWPARPRCNWPIRLLPNTGTNPDRRCDPKSSIVLGLYR